jgi:hypothetical protein
MPISPCAAEQRVTGELASWEAGEPVPDHLFARMTAHEAFPHAVRSLAASMLELGDGDRALAGIFKDAGRYVTAMCAASMPEGVTLTGLKALCAQFGLLSPGRARAVLFYMRYLGYVSLWSEREGRGPAQYRLTERFKAAWRAQFRAALQAARLIDAGCEEAIRRLDSDPAFFGSLCRIQVRHLALGMPRWDSTKRFVDVFMSRHGGTQIVWTLLVQGGDGDFPFRGPLALPKMALARRFGVSRMHVKRLSGDAVTNSLFSKDGQGRFFFTDEGLDQIRYVYASQLIRLLTVCNEALSPKKPPPFAHPQ